MLDFILDVVIEGILWTAAEKLCCLFCALAFMLIPEKKRSKKMENAVKLLGLFIGLSMLVLWVIGIVEIFASDGKSIIGWVFTVISNLYIFVSVIYGSVGGKGKRNRKKEE